MKRDLMLRAWSDLKTAKYCMSTGDDEYDLCLAAYHIQQAVGKTLKSCLKELGIDYTKTHRIESLLQLLPPDQSIISDDVYERLYDKSSSLTAWKQIPVMLKVI